MLEKILRAEPIDWDLLSSYILKQKHNPKQHQRNSSILLAVVKTQDVPLHIVQSLILPSSTSTGNRINLKTLRNAFECSCRCSSAFAPTSANQNEDANTVTSTNTIDTDTGVDVRELLLHEIMNIQSSPSMKEILLLRAIQHNCQDAIDAIVKTNDPETNVFVPFLSPGFHREENGTFYEDDAFGKLCDRLMSMLAQVHCPSDTNKNQKEEAHLNRSYTKDLIFHAEVLHATAYRGHQPLTHRIATMFPGTLMQKDRKYHNLPLHSACEGGQWDVAGDILAMGIRTNQFQKDAMGGLLVKNKKQKSALQLALRSMSRTCTGGAASHGEQMEAVVRMIVSVDADVNPSATPMIYNDQLIKDVDLLHRLVCHGVCPSIIEGILCYHPTAIQWKDAFGNTPLQLAFENGQIDIATRMYNACVAKEKHRGSSGVSEDSRRKKDKHVSLDKHLRDAIAAALLKLENPDRIVEFIIHTNPSLTPSLTCMDVVNLMHHVAGKGSVPYAKKLVQSHPLCITIRDSAGALPIHWACRELNCDMIEYLLLQTPNEYGCLLTSDANGICPLQYILEAYQDVDSDGDLMRSSQCLLTCLQTIHKLPLIHYAISVLNVDVEVIQELVETFPFPFDPNCRWQHRKTALVHVIDTFANDRQMESHQLLLDTFLDSGNATGNLFHPCLSMIDDQGSLPLHYALSLGMRWEEYIKKLVDTNFHSLAQLDGKTGLKPFMLSAVGPRCDLNTTFHLLRYSPII